RRVARVTEARAPRRVVRPSRSRVHASSSPRPTASIQPSGRFSASHPRVCDRSSSAVSACDEEGRSTAIAGSYRPCRTIRRVLEAYGYEAGKHEPEPLGLEEAAGLVGTRHPYLVWISIEDPTDDDITELAGALDLDPFLVEDLREGSNGAGQRPKLL